MQEYLDMWRSFADFSGRTSVRGYWMAVLFNFLAALVVGFLDGLLGLGFLAALYSLAILIPMLAIGIRRLRDSGRNWAWIFIILVPLVGWIIYIIMLCQPSVAAPQQNSYSNPLDEFQY